LGEPTGFQIKAEQVRSVAPVGAYQQFLPVGVPTGVGKIGVMAVPAVIRKLPDEDAGVWIGVFPAFRGESGTDGHANASLLNAADRRISVYQSKNTVSEKTDKSPLHGACETI
jgi:hypothetical protein